MKRLLSVLFFTIHVLFSSSPHLVDAQCSSEGGIWTVHFFSGTSDREDKGWQRASFSLFPDVKEWQGVIQNKQQMSKGYLSKLSFDDLLSIITSIKSSGDAYEPLSKKENIVLHGIGSILKDVHYRDPVRFTTFCDGVIKCAESANIIVH